MGWRAAVVAGLEFVVTFVSYDQVYDPRGSSVRSKNPLSKRLQVCLFVR